MNRRDFLARLRRPAVAIAAAPAIAVAAAADARRELPDPQVASLKARLSAMKARLERMEKSHKRTVRALLVVGAVLLGVDITLLI